MRGIFIQNRHKDEINFCVLSILTDKKLTTAQTFFLQPSAFVKMSSQHPTFHTHVFDDNHRAYYYKHNGLSLGPTLYFDEERNLQMITFENVPYDSQTYEIGFVPNSNPSILHITHTRYTYSTAQTEPHRELVEQYGFDVDNEIDAHNYRDITLVNKYASSDKHIREAERNHHTCKFVNKEETHSYSHKHKDAYEGIQLSFYKDTHHLHLLSCFKEGLRDGFTLLFGNDFQGQLLSAHYYDEGFMRFQLNYAEELELPRPSSSPSPSHISSTLIESMTDE